MRRPAHQEKTLERLGRWRETLMASRRRMTPDALAEQVARLELTNAALIDCTADASIVDAYPAFVNANLHIITPNKCANVLPWRRYAALMELLRARRKHFLYEANVGADAGEPVRESISGFDERERSGRGAGKNSRLFRCGGV